MDLVDTSLVFNRDLGIPCTTTGSSGQNLTVEPKCRQNNKGNHKPTSRGWNHTTSHLIDLQIDTYPHM